MTVKINGNELYINDKLYATADKISDFILETIRSKTKSNNQLQLLYAILITLHQKTGTILHMMDDNDLDIIMKAWDIEKTKKPGDQA